MSRKAIWEFFKAIYERYHKAPRETKHQILTEFCATTGYNRKYAIRKLNGPPPSRVPPARSRRRGYTYGVPILAILTAVWEAAGYPCSVRLKAILVGWLPWIRKRFALSPSFEKQLLSISPRQIDRRLREKKAHLKNRLYGRTKPGTLLKHQIPIKTDHWDVTTPGFTEVDTVVHCGNSAEGEFGSTVNQTDILTGWVESRAVLGRGERGVVQALDEMAQALPFPLRGIDSDNGSEFINWHLVRYCQPRDIQLSRGRPYKKNDNAHIEQKNWTHVRKLLGWDRYDTPQAIEAMNHLYTQELRLFMNLFMPSMKLLKKQRIGSKLKRVYDAPQTSLERVGASGQGDAVKIAELTKLRDSLDPFALAHTIEKKLEHIFTLANRRHSPSLPQRHPAIPKRLPSGSRTREISAFEKDSLKVAAEVLGMKSYYRNRKGQLVPTGPN